jgi:vacuolar protein sorting-associated protein 52
LANRETVIKDIEAPMIVPHELNEKDVKFPFEMIFRSINHYFVESASSEYLFILDFFSLCKELTKGEKDTTYSGKLVISMFKPAMLSIKENLISYINTSFDPIGFLKIIFFFHFFHFFVLNSTCF